jgi:thioredoxin-related protein
MSYKHYLIPYWFLPTLLLAQTSTAPTNIQFVQQNWKIALDSAKKQQKIIFLDAYTTWCAPCKAMNRTIFTDKTVAAYYNRHFVNVQMDMEQGDGIGLAAAYQIKAYPTLLFIYPDGKVAHRGVGYQEVAAFLELGRTALNKEERLGAWHERYTAGERDAVFLKKYIQKLTEAFDPKRLQVTETYLKTQPDWRKREHLDLIYRMVETTETPLYSFFVTNRDTFKSIFGKADVEIKIQNLLSDKLYNEKQLPALSYADSLIQLTYPNKAKRLKANYRLHYHRMRGDRGQYALAATKYFKEFDDNSEELNETAQTFYEVIDDPKMLHKAIKWSKKALKKERRQLYYVTLAQLHLKVGDKKHAKNVLNDAIEQGKKVGDRHDEASELLKEIN